MEEGDICGERFFVAKESLPAPSKKAILDFAGRHFSHMRTSEAKETNGVYSPHTRYQGHFPRTR